MAVGNSIPRVLEPENIAFIRSSLAIGFFNFCETERVIDELDRFGGVGTSVPHSILPLHPTGASDTRERFSKALAMLDEFSNDTAGVSLEGVEAVRYALIVGLSSFGEIRRVSNEWKTMASSVESLPGYLKPTQLAGNCGKVVGDFADSLMFLESAQREVREMGGCHAD